MYDDATQKKREKLQRGFGKADDLARNEFVKAALATAQGRKYLWWLLGIGKAIGSQPFTSNALTTAFNCGALDVGNQIMSHLIEVSPGGFSDLMKEMANERKTRDGQLAELGAEASDES